MMTAIDGAGGITGAFTRLLAGLGTAHGLRLGPLSCSRARPDYSLEHRSAAHHARAAHTCRTRGRTKGR